MGEIAASYVTIYPKFASGFSSGITSEVGAAGTKSGTMFSSGGMSGGSASAPPAGQFRIGDDVLHGKWGEGVVVDLRGSGDKTEITVNFPTVGQKVLLLAWAPLKKA